MVFIQHPLKNITPLFADVSWETIDRGLAWRRETVAEIILRCGFTDPPVAMSTVNMVTRADDCQTVLPILTCCAMYDRYAPF